VDVIAAFVADAQPPVLVQPGDRALDDPRFVPSPEPWSLFGQAIFARMCRRRSSARPSREWYARSPYSARGRRRGRPRRPRTGGISSMSGISWVMSLRLPPVSEQASGVPRPQATT
jgi:hypothetical protein